MNISSVNADDFAAITQVVSLEAKEGKEIVQNALYCLRKCLFCVFLVELDWQWACFRGMVPKHLRIALLT